MGFKSLSSFWLLQVDFYDSGVLVAPINTNHFAVGYSLTKKLGKYILCSQFVLFQIYYTMLTICFISDWDDQSFKYPMLNYEECNEGDSHLGIFRCQKFDLDMMVWVYTMDPIGNYEVTRAIYTRKNGRCGLAY